MTSRLRFTTFLLAGSLVSLTLAALPRTRHASTTPQATSETRTQTHQTHILVAPAVSVSQANPSRTDWEVQIAADPADAKRLIACSKLQGDDQTYLRSWPDEVVVYISGDGGLNWQPTYQSDQHQHYTDPSCAFGPDGSAYFMFFGGNPGSRFQMLMYRSMDGGKRWTEEAVSEVLDREYITIDDTVGKYHGRIYVHGVKDQSGIDGARMTGLGIFRSTDKGETYRSVKLVDEGTQYVLGDANGIVMSDGAFANIFGDLLDYSLSWVREMHPRTPNAKLKFIASSDGGETFGKATIISDWYMRNILVLNGVPSLAVDRTQGPFQDRRYAAWVDARSGRGEIRFAHSDDKGKTWFPSHVISDNWPHDERGETPDAFMPVLVVNRNGVLGVMWYDRRDHPDNQGYDVRFSASLDGGESFLPSVLVSEDGGSALQMKEATLWGPWHAPTNPDGRTHAGFGWAWGDNGGDTAGLACDPDGTFHPLWIDRRSEVQQVSTTRVTVNGTAIPNGGGGLETLRDFSTKVEVRYSLTHVDLATNVITIGAAIANVSKELIPGRLTLRLLGLSSNSGLIEAQNADNGITAGGAIWEFHSATGGSLQPGALTAPRQLRFKLAHALFPPAPLRSSSQSDLVELDTKILGK